MGEIVKQAINRSNDHSRSNPLFMGQGKSKAALIPCDTEEGGNPKKKEKEWFGAPNSLSLGEISALKNMLFRGFL